MSGVVGSVMDGVRLCKPDANNQKGAENERQNGGRQHRN